MDWVLCFEVLDLILKLLVAFFEPLYFEFIPFFFFFILFDQLRLNLRLLILNLFLLLTICQDWLRIAVLFYRLDTLGFFLVAFQLVFFDSFVGLSTRHPGQVVATEVADAFMTTDPVNRPLAKLRLLRFDQLANAFSVVGEELTNNWDIVIRVPWNLTIF